ncbi:penicillin-binding protein PBP2B [Streptococcus sp. DD13]|uniref:penicillin-binding protein PBP2B n=1 Tax=Streptococcus sp. DD13 TaxID=1777881 RepID=UPI003FA68BD7
MKKKANKNVIPRRINVLFAFVLLLFVILIGRLIHMQIVNQSFYQDRLATASQKKISRSSVRGGIYDASGKALVENKVRQVVTYTRSNKATALAMRTVAQKLLSYVQVNNPTVTQRQKADYYLADPQVYSKVIEALPRDQRLDQAGNRLEESVLYGNAVASLKEDQLNYSKEEEKAIQLFSEMNAASYFETVNLQTEALTAEQIAKIAANENELPGISTGSDWDRVVLDTSLSSLIGTVTTSQAGLPEADAASYLAKGYSLNDRVGTAYLEKQYEDDLQGTHQVKEVQLDKSGNVESIETLQEGSKGNNLKLTLDLKFQDGVSAILKRHFQTELNSGSATYSDGVYAVVMRPNDGSILAMAGYQHDAGAKDIKENALGNITNVFVPGSIVKGATLTAGWQNQVISGNQVLTDQPIQLAGSSVINSWFTNYGQQNLTAVQALEYSSNTYMVQIALKLIGQEYQAGIYLPSDQSVIQAGMTKLRTAYGQYGLGVSTGIDLPSESTGYLPTNYTSWNYITESFGQFDNYTPLQMAQYAATVANGGKRIAPHLVAGIYDNAEDGGLGKEIRGITGKELNQVDLSASDMGLIQEGFYEVVHGTSGFTTGTEMNGASLSISAKTGTAETFVTNSSGQTEQAINTNIVAYAPSNKPEIAVSVVLPNLTDLNSVTSKAIVKDIVNLYHQLYQ